MQAPSAPPDRYTRTAVVLHWLIGIALIGEIAFGFLLREIPRGTPERGPWVNLHKSTGIVLGILILARIAWRFAHRPPALPATFSPWESAAARFNHAAMYTCMVTIPVAGYLASNFSKYGVKFFSTVVLPPWGPELPRVYALLNGIHDVAAYVLTVLIALHVLAALKHALIDRDRPFSRLTLRSSPRS